MPTKKELIDNILLELYQGAPSDDGELSNEQIAFWLNIHVNEVVANEINQKMAKGEMVPNIYIRKAACQVLEAEESTCGDDCQDRVYAELEDEVLNVNKGGGIITVWDEDGNEIKKADIQSLSLFKNMRFSKPSANNVLYSHEGTKVFFPGLKAVDIGFDEVNIWYVPKQDILNAADTDEVLISDLSLPIVIDSVVDRGKRELFGSVSDPENDGVAKVAPVFHQQIRQANG
jgi:hypothetical protein